MFIVHLTFSAQKSRARELMSEHEAWIARGFQAGIFALVGSLEPRRGGVVVAHGIGRDELDRTLAEDPFVAHGVVEAEVFEVTPAKTDPRLAFMVSMVS